MENEIVISLKNVSKTFITRKGQADTIRDVVFTRFKKVGKKTTFKALNDINFEIRKGETFGIIGKNGSGKSTLIHLIMGSMKPDLGGKINTKGVMMRMALGMGMDPQLSARDNIYVNGSILGLSFKQIGTLFEDIIAYADLEEFVDTPVKQFSKGMAARLKFSIAIHANADIFLLDEFFGGVGDEDFKAKSNKAFKDRFIEGKTNIVVSHSMKIISKFCTRVLWIDNGVQKMIGEPKEVIKYYKSSFKSK